MVHVHGKNTVTGSKGKRDIPEYLQPVADTKDIAEQKKGQAEIERQPEHTAPRQPLMGHYCQGAEKEDKADVHQVKAKARTLLNVKCQPFHLSACHGYQNVVRMALEKAFHQG